MPKIFFQVLVSCMTVFLYGCGSSGVVVHGYMEDKPRVDQDRQGNAGYLIGTPRFETPAKPSRKVYTLEVTKEDKEKIKKQKTKEQKTTPVSPRGTQSFKQSTPQPSPVDTRDTYSPPQISLPNTNEEETPSAKSVPSSSGSGQPGQYTEYKVEKDDTLQKLAKKFYNAFGQWTKIYDLNRDVIKNPDRLKPGTVLKIPKE